MLVFILGQPAIIRGHKKSPEVPSLLHSELSYCGVSRYQIILHDNTQRDKLCKPKSEKVGLALHGLQLSVKLRKANGTTSGATSLIFYFNRERMIGSIF